MYARVERLEFPCATHGRFGLRVSTHLGQYVAELAVDRGVLRVQAQRPPKPHLRRFPIPFQQPVHIGGGGLRLGKVRIDPECFIRGALGTRPHHERRRIAVHHAGRVRESHGAPGQRVLGVEPDRPLVGVERLSIPERRTQTRELPAAKILVVRLDILRLSSIEAGQLIWRELEAHLLRDCGTQLTLEPEHTRDIVLERVGPDMFLVLYPDQFCRRAQTPALHQQ